MRVRENLGSIVSSIGKNNYTPANKAQVGRVYGIVTTENTPTKKQFERVGGFNGVGTIFYLDYAQSKEVIGTIDDNFFNTCKTAKPLYPQYQYYPLKGELVFLEDLPSPVSQISNTSTSKYYISVVNLWNNQQQNSQPANDNAILGLTFVENPNIKPLLPFEGDHLLQGRQGAGLRFSSTTKLFRNINEWSSIGNDTDPITILTNGFSYVPNESFHTEKINGDLSSIYLTSAQKIPLKTDKSGILNNLTNPLNIPDYTKAQVILNSNRVVLNSKRDEVMIFASTNIELNTKNTINLNADYRVHLNSNQIFLGPYNKNNPPQPVLLGYDTYKVFEQIQSSLVRLAGYLASAVGAPEGAPVLTLNAAGKELLDDMSRTCDLLEKITSKKVFTN